MASTRISLLERIKSLFPDCPVESIFHLFSGPINEGITFDINPELNPTICDDVRNIKNHSRIFENINMYQQIIELDLFLYLKEFKVVLIIYFVGKTNTRD